jgi:hypothetical protein
VGAADPVGFTCNLSSGYRLFIALNKKALSVGQPYKECHFVQMASTHRKVTVHIVEWGTSKEFPHPIEEIMSPSQVGKLSLLSFFSKLVAKDIISYYS